MFIDRPGKVQLDKLVKVMNLERLEQHYIHDSERLMNEIFPACSKAKGEIVANTFYIMDLKGVTARMMGPRIWELMRIGTKIGQDYYPEILGTMFIINTPLFFHGCWSIIKNFVDEKTRKKIHILGSNYKKELLQFVDENDLPDFFGGKLTEKDYGPNLTNEQGPWVKATADNMTMPGNSPVEIDAENLSISHRNSTAIKDSVEVEATYMDGVNNSLIGLPKQIEELIDADFCDIAEEMCERVFVKEFRSNRYVAF